MVSGKLVDALVSPSTTIRDLFAKAVAEGSADDFPAVVKSYFSALFAGDAIEQIPLLGTARPPDAFEPDALIRFRAMIQDTSYSPEMYLSSLKHSKCGGWGLDVVESLPEDLDVHFDFNVLKERDVIWAVSIPGEGHWCDPSRAPAGSIGPNVPHIAANTSQYKPHKFPIPGSTHVAAQLKVYDGSAESLKPATIHDFVGILTFELIHSDFVTDALVPTLHVVFHHMLPRTISPARPSEPDGILANLVRDELINWMASEALGGDRDAAEWVLLSTLSSVESRSPPLFPVPITLSGFTKPVSQDVPSISLMLSEMLPLHFLLPLDLKFLNEQSFRPESKDEDLHAGVLQVPNDTTIVITETGVSEGNLAEKGLENVQALQEVAKLQTLQYKFPFSQYSFPTDIKLITITDGKESLFLESDINIPLRPAASPSLYRGRDSIEWPSPDKLAAFRDFIVRAKSAKVRVDENLSEHIKDDFVRERQAKASVTPEDLARWMTTARLISLSRLEGQMSIDTWNTAKALDNRRKSRLS